MDAFNGFNNNAPNGVFSNFMDGEITAAAMVFQFLQRVGAYGFVLALLVTGVILLLPKKGQEMQETKQRLIRIAIAVVLFFGFFTIVGMVGSFLETSIPAENTQIGF